MLGQNLGKMQFLSNFLENYGLGVTWSHARVFGDKENIEISPCLRLGLTWVRSVVTRVFLVVRTGVTECTRFHSDSVLHHLVSLGVSRCHLVSLGFTWFHLVSLGVTWCHLVSLGFTWTRCHITWYHSVSLVVTWCHLVSLGFTGFHWVQAKGHSLLTAHLFVMLLRDGSDGSNGGDGGGSDGDRGNGIN